MLSLDEVGETSTLSAGRPTTETEIVCLCPPVFVLAVIVVFPGVLPAVIRPLELTEAMFGCADSQMMTLSSAFAGSTPAMI
jgi:hypothetical protein